ncbi:MAG: c-type cytochrome [Cyclobacteriaceae bacterium]
MKKIFKYIPVLFLSLAATSKGAAQASDASGFSTLEAVATTALVISILVMLLLVFVLRALQTFVNSKRAEALAEAKARGEELTFEDEGGFWAKFHDVVPIEKEDEILTDHAYDGIRELDNNLPPWWRYMFYITIVFGVIYLLHYHVLGTGQLSAEEYETEMAIAEAQVAAAKEASGGDEVMVDESTVALVTDEARLKAGKTMYVTYCAACHAADGGGGVGPNFTDNYWMHGGSVGDIFSSIKYGIPDKGMIAWGNQLTPAEMENLASVVLGFVGQTAANPKEPQGELYEPEGE